VLRRSTPQEIAAAEWFSGRGAARVLAVDRARGELRLERVVPGTHLRELFPEHDEAATAAAAEVMRALWRPPDAAAGFPTVRHWGGSLTPGSRAAGVFFELCDSMAAPVVLHGDLHHDNLLWSDRDGWLAIDPKGVIGEPAYETGALLRNPCPGLLDVPDPARLLRRRVDQLSEALELDPARVRRWAYCQAALAAAWSVEDGEDPAFWLAVAELWDPLSRGS
jgi:streptomycin 6-kinase